MQLTMKEMEILCVFHSGTLSETLGLLQEAASKKGEPPDRMAAIDSLVEKLSRMREGDVVCLAFEPEK